MKRCVACLLLTGLLAGCGVTGRLTEDAVNPSETEYAEEAVVESVAALYLFSEMGDASPFAGWPFVAALDAKLYAEDSFQPLSGEEKPETLPVKKVGFIHDDLAVTAYYEERDSEFFLYCFEVTQSQKPRTGSVDVELNGRLLLDKDEQVWFEVDGAEWYYWKESRSQIRLDNSADIRSMLDDAAFPIDCGVNIGEYTVAFGEPITADLNTLRVKGDTMHRETFFKGPGVGSTVKIGEGDSLGDLSLEKLQVQYSFSGGTPYYLSYVFADFVGRVQLKGILRLENYEGPGGGEIYFEVAEGSQHLLPVSEYSMADGVSFFFSNADEAKEVLGDEDFEFACEIDIDRYDYVCIEAGIRCNAQLVSVTMPNGEKRVVAPQGTYRTSFTTRELYRQPRLNYHLTLTQAGEEGDDPMLWKASVDIVDCETYTAVQTIEFEVPCSVDGSVGLLTAKQFVDGFTGLCDVNIDDSFDLLFNMGGYHNSTWRVYLWDKVARQFAVEQPVEIMSSSPPKIDWNQLLLFTTATESATDHRWTAVDWEGTAMIKQREVRIFECDGEIWCTDTSYQNGVENELLSLSLSAEASKEPFAMHFQGNRFWQEHFEYGYYLENIPFSS